jgi:serine/threonine protein kinase
MPQTVQDQFRYIRVPFPDKDEAKALGARWDAEVKCWFIPQGVDPAKLREWWAYLECPYEEKDAARQQGAKWDKALKKWYVPENSDIDEFEQWWPGWVVERVALTSEDESEPTWHFVDGQLGGRYGFMFSEEYQKDGGTARVFFGWRVDPDTGELEEDEMPTVAIKNFFTDDDSLDFTMFDREVSTLKALSDHPNIVSLVDYGFDTTDRTFFAVTEYHPTSLGELISASHSGKLTNLGEEVDLQAEFEEIRKENKNLSPDQRWLEEFEELGGILNGLCHALESGVYHRDLKPGNILCAIDDEAGDVTVKLCDFGIASSPTSFDGAATVRFVGTEMYTPQSDDEEEHPGARDVYSWGVIAVELLSDEVLTTEEEVRKAFETEVKPEIPSVIGRVLERCLHEDPSKRPENAKVLLDEIHEANKALDTNG